MMIIYSHLMYNQINSFQKANKVLSKKLLQTLSYQPLLFPVFLFHIQPIAFFTLLFSLLFTYMEAIKVNKVLALGQD